jgi:hypothetical protein
VQENNEWRNRKRGRYIFIDPDMVAIIGSRRLRLLEYVLCREGTSLLRISLANNPRGRIPHGLVPHPQRPFSNPYPEPNQSYS